MARNSSGDASGFVLTRKHPEDRTYGAGNYKQGRPDILAAVLIVLMQQKLFSMPKLGVVAVDHLGRLVH